MIPESMEIESEDGSRLSLKPGTRTVFGRGEGFRAEDSTVSRRHVLLEVDSADPEPRVSFEVVGKNPVWVRREETGKVEIFRRLEKGKATIGDSFCVSGQRPIWFTFKKCVAEGEISDVDNGLDSVDISNLDPVKAEFGFLEIGKEFEQYSKNRVHDVRPWDWFLDEQKKQDSESDDDDEQVSIKGKKRTGKKRSRSKGKDDEDWTGDSEEDKDVIAKSRKSQRPKYSTRSKGLQKRKEYVKNGKIKRDALEEEDNDDEDNEDEDDETLGGFIVGDEDGAEEEEGDESGEEEEEEEDFEDED